MKRIDGSDRAVDLFGAGKDGFKAQVPGVSLATQLTDKWFNAVQEALVRTIEGAGIALSETDYDQFKTAINTLDAAARDAAIAAAATDATTKANAAQAAAIAAAASDATTKANAAQAAAISAAASDATTKANAAQAAAISAAASDATTKANAVIPSGTRMLFQQSTAPTGWTKDTTHNDKALRVVSGAVGSGGALDFSAAFVTGNTGSHTLTTAEIPPHVHGTPVYARDGSSAHIGDGGSTATYTGVTTDSAGGGGAHSHPIDLNIKYVDIIIASKN